MSGANRGPAPRPRRWSLLIGGFVALCCGVFLSGFIVFVFRLDWYEQPGERRADAIIALTGGADRIADAVGLLAEGKGRRLLVTGVNPGTNAREIGRLTPRFFEFVDCCIDLGYQAVNTAGNAEEARAWMRSHGFGSAIIVTAAYHMPRAIAEMSQADPDMVLIPHVVVPDRLRGANWWTDTQILKLMTVEYMKYLRTLVMAAGARPAPDDRLVKAMRHGEPTSLSR